MAKKKPSDLLDLISDFIKSQEDILNSQEKLLESHKVLMDLQRRLPQQTEESIEYQDKFLKFQLKILSSQKDAYGHLKNVIDIHKEMRSSFSKLPILPISIKVKGVEKLKDLDDKNKKDENGLARELWQKTLYPDFQQPKNSQSQKEAKND